MRMLAYLIQGQGDLFISTYSSACVSLTTGRLRNKYMVLGGKKGNAFVDGRDCRT